jgi:flagellar protein FliS
MYAIARRAIDTYATVGLETGVDAADPHKLILMLYDGAIFALADAKTHMAKRHIAEKGAAISKAIRIIEEGLKASLDVPAAGELGRRLAALYDYMVGRLLIGNLQNRVEFIDEVSRLLGELRSAWEEIRPPAGSVSTATPVSASTLARA